eukprot:Selendium_serpulae@DN5933_c1_g1_i1.p1
MAVLQRLIAESLSNVQTPRIVFTGLVGRILLLSLSGADTKPPPPREGCAAVDLSEIFSRRVGLKKTKARPSICLKLKNNVNSNLQQLRKTRRSRLCIRLRANRESGVRCENPVTSSADFTASVPAVPAVPAPVRRQAGASSTARPREESPVSVVQRSAMLASIEQWAAASPVESVNTAASLATNAVASALSSNTPLSNSGSIEVPRSSGDTSECSTGHQSASLFFD